MFKIIPNPTFVGIAKIAAPGGEVLDLRIVFKHRTVTQLQEFLAEAAKNERSDVDGLLEIVEGWEEVDAPFSREALAQILDNYHDVVTPVMNAFFEAIRGAKEGN
jgi:bacterioferritin (cytochrome b1)